MNTTISRPLAVWVYSIALGLWIAWSASESLKEPSARLVGLTSYVPFVIGAVGFWLMRWWSVVLLAATAALAVIIWPREDLVIQIIAGAVVVGPAAIIALLHRKRFRW